MPEPSEIAIRTTASAAEGSPWERYWNGVLERIHCGAVFASGRFSRLDISRWAASFARPLGSRAAPSCTRTLDNSFDPQTGELAEPRLEELRNPLNTNDKVARLLPGVKFELSDFGVGDWGISLKEKTGDAADDLFEFKPKTSRVSRRRQRPCLPISRLTAEGPMAFDDVLARDPKSEEEFWEIIERDLRPRLKARYRLSSGDERGSARRHAARWQIQRYSCVRPSAVGDPSQCIAASETPAASHQPRLAASRPCVQSG